MIQVVEDCTSCFDVVSVEAHNERLGGSVAQTKAPAAKDKPGPAKAKPAAKPEKK